MCAPAAVLIPLIGLGVQGGAAVASNASARGAAGRSQAEQDRFNAAVHASATENTRMALQDLDARSVEEMLSAAQQQDVNTRQGNSIRSTSIVAAGEAGVTGNSVDELLNDVQAQTSRNKQTITANENITQAQIQRDREQAIAQGKSQYDSAQKTQINKPSPLSPILQIAGATLNTVDYLQGRTAGLDKTPNIQPAIKASSHMSDYVLGA